MSENELNAVASALRALTPSAAPLDRDALMYQAGRAAAPQPRWPWVLATAASMLLAVGFGIALLARPVEVRTVDRFLPQPPPAPAPAPVPAPPVETPTAPERPAAVPYASPWEPAPTEYEQARESVLRWGLDGLPPAPRTRHEPVTEKQVLWPF